MAVTTFVIYKKTNLLALKYLPVGFILTSTAYTIIGYHTSYCEVCSDLTLCGASHSYPNYLIITALIILVLTIILLTKKININAKTFILKTFVIGLIIATILLMTILFASLQYMEIPNVIDYVESINLQAIFFIFPILSVAWVFFYLKKSYKIPKSILTIFILLSISFLPQFYHILICKDCHSMECSEFYILAGLLMYIAVGIIIHSISIQLQEKN